MIVSDNMQQRSVTDYFKVKKRTREEPLKSKSKSTKLVAILAESGKKSPNRISSVTPEASSPDLSPSPVKYFSPSRQKDIFSSPVKLSEIRSPVKKSPALAGKSAVKRLFCNDSGSDSESSPALKSRKVPAFERFSHLAQKTIHEELGAASAEGPPIPAAGTSSSEAVPKLLLPLKYNDLLEVFRAVETAAYIYHKRDQVITFTNLKNAVQQLMRKFPLREKHLGQILEVFPDCYKLTQEKVMKPRPNEPHYQLCLALNFTATSNMSENLIMTERGKIFHKNLINICQEYHKKFLLTIDPPVVIPAGKKVTRWHPGFPLNDVLDIPASPVPQPPESNVRSNLTAQDVMARAQEILRTNSNPRMKKAMDELQRKSEAEKSSVSVQPVGSPQPQLAASTAGLRITESPTRDLGATKLAFAKLQENLLRRAKQDPNKAKALQDILARKGKPVDAVSEVNASRHVNIVPAPAAVSASSTAELPANKPQTVSVDNNKKNTFGASLKGIKSSLLEKIRAREQEKSIKAMTLTPVEIKKRAMLGRLPEFVKILRNTMVVEKKAALPLIMVVDKICNSQRGSMNEVDGEGHVRLLAELVPEWITLFKCTTGEYLKMDKSLDINDLLLKLNDISR